MKERKKIFVTIIIVLFAIASALAGTYISKEAQDAIETVQNIVLDELDKTETQQSNIETKENKSTTVIEDLTEEDEQLLEEQEIEDEAFELQGNIAYERR